MLLEPPHPRAPLALGSRTAPALLRNSENWARRPLTQDELTYAACDVVALLPIYELFCSHFNVPEYWRRLDQMCGRYVDYFRCIAERRLRQWRTVFQSRLFTRSSNRQHAILFRLFD